MLLELINETLIEKIIQINFALAPQLVVSDSLLTKDDENILRYACGFVAMKLKKFTKMSAGDKTAKFLECLDKMEMAIDGPESSFYDYTREWITKVDRGGLFKVSDGAYSLFVAIEHAINGKIHEHLQCTSRKTLACDGEGETKQMIVKTICEDVLFRWTLLEMDDDPSSDRMELLKHIVSLWLTIRGFSVSKYWMERYKQKENTSTKKAKGLQKELSKSNVQSK